MADRGHAESKVDSRCLRSQDGWMLPQQPSDTLKEEASTEKRAQSPPATDNCFLGSPHPTHGLPCPCSPRHTDKAFSWLFGLPPPRGRLPLLHAGRNACSQAEASDGCPEGASRGNVQKPARFWLCFCRMKGLDAVKTDIYQKFCLPAWGMWSPFHARVSCCGCLRTGATRRNQWFEKIHLAAMDFNLLQMDNFETSKDYKLRLCMLEKTRFHQQ